MATPQHKKCVSLSKKLTDSGPRGCVASIQAVGNKLHFWSLGTKRLAVIDLCRSETCNGVVHTMPTAVSIVILVATVAASVF